MERRRAVHISDTQIVKWWCGHVLHLREYIREYPSHALIELDLYDTSGTNSVLHDLFQADAMDGEGKECWGKSNTKEEFEAKKAKTENTEKTEKLGKNGTRDRKREQLETEG